MARKFYDLAAKGEEYQDRDGNTKHRFQNAGKLCVEDDGRMWVQLEWPGVNMMVSVFEQKARDGSSESHSGGSAKQRGSKSNDDLDDSVPF